MLTILNMSEKRKKCFYGPPVPVSLSFNKFIISDFMDDTSCFSNFTSSLRSSIFLFVSSILLFVSSILLLREALRSSILLLREVFRSSILLFVSSILLLVSSILLFIWSRRRIITSMLVSFFPSVIFFAILSDACLSASSRTDVTTASPQGKLPRERYKCIHLSSHLLNTSGE
jgi:hypothetical protein